MNNQELGGADCELGRVLNGLTGWYNLILQVKPKLTSYTHFIGDKTESQWGLLFAPSGKFLSWDQNTVCVEGGGGGTQGMLLCPC